MRTNFMSNHSTPLSFAFQLTVMIRSVTDIIGHAYLTYFNSPEICKYAPQGTFQITEFE